MGNGWGKRRTDLATLMREHDALPRGLRLVDCHTNALWAADSIAFVASEVAAASGGGLDQGELLRRTAAILDAETAVDTWRDYGPAHPNCPDHLRTRRPPKGAWWNAKRRAAR